MTLSKLNLKETIIKFKFLEFPPSTIEYVKKTTPHGSLEMG